MTSLAGNVDSCAALLQSWGPFSSSLPSRSAEEPSDVYSSFGHSAGSSPCDANLQYREQIGGRSVSCPSFPVQSSAKAVGECLTDNVACGREFTARLKGEHEFVGSSLAVQSNGYGGGRICAHVGLWREGELSAAHLGNGRFDTGQDVPNEMVSKAFCSRQSSLFEGRKRIGSWSRRGKQFSHAFRKGLWRWREGYHAKKRRKRTSQGSCSCSGRSWASDPSTVHSPVCARSVTGTDSSGELFYGGAVNRPLWNTESPSIGLEGNLILNGRSDIRDCGAELCACRLGNSTPCIEAGYDSEPGYNADAELTYLDEGAGDEEDEDELESLHFSAWKTLLSKSKSAQKYDHPEYFGDHMVKLIIGRDSNARKVPSQIRHRSRSWRKMAVHLNRCLLDLNISCFAG